MTDTLSVGSSDQDDRMQYVKKDFLQPANNHNHNASSDIESRSATTNDDDDNDNDDDSSSRFFVSEPSMSVATSEADSSDNLMQSIENNSDCLLFLVPSADDADDLLLYGDVRLPLRNPLPQPSPPPNSPPQTTRTTNMNHSTTVEGSDTTETTTAFINNNNLVHAIRPHPPPPAASYSPDNMSLSSYDTASPNRWTQKVHLDFSPVRPSENNKALSPTSNTTGNNHHRRDASIGGMNTKNINTNINNNNERDSITQTKCTHTTPKRLVIADKPIAANSPSNSTSEASEGELQQLEEFLDDLRINSEGQVKESFVPGTNTSFDSSVLLHGSTDVEDVLRRSVVSKLIPRQRQPPPPPQHPPRHVTTATSSRDSSTRSLFMESTDSFTTRGADSIIMTLSDDTGDHQILAGDMIETSLFNDTTSSAQQSPVPSLPSLPPLPPLHSSTTAVGGKQQRDSQRRRNDCETQYTKQNKNTIPVPRGRGTSDQRYSNNSTNSDTSSPNISTNPERNNNFRNNLKSTIDNQSGDEWSQSQNVQEREIGLFSQFAIGTGDGDVDGVTRRRRTKQRSYRQMRTKHTQPDSGEDSSSHASSDQSYTNFFQSPASSISQPPSDVIYESAPQVPSPRTASGGYAQTPYSMHFSNNDNKNNNGSLIKRNSLNLTQPKIDESSSTYYGSYDGAQHGYLRHPSPPIQLDPNLIRQGGLNYQPLPRYIPRSNHQRVHSEAMTNMEGNLNMGGNLDMGSSFDQRFQFEQHPQQQHSHNHHHHSESMPHFERPFDGNYIHPRPQHFFPDNRISETSIMSNNFPHIGSNHRSYSPVHMVGSAERQLSQQELQQQQRQRKDSFVNGDSPSVSDHSSDDSIENERNIHCLHEEKHPDNRGIRHHYQDTSPFLPNVKKTAHKFDRRQFLPQTSCAHESADNKYPTYICPICKTRQREFFTVSSAPKQFESAGIYVSLFFAVYVIISLYVFGLQEGWGKLDCIYFAVITLTTAGLGDLVPTTDGAKIICSIFIYFGVACIGLLLGSYIAGMLDERSYREAIANQIKACPNCARIQNIKDASHRRMNGFVPAKSKASMAHVAEMHATSLRDATSLRNKTETERASKKIRRSSNETPAFSESERVPTSHSMNRDDLSNIQNQTSPFHSPSIVQRKTPESPSVQKQLLGSPMTSQILGRQSHTRHMSMDLRGGASIGSTTSNALVSPRSDLGRFRTNSVDIPATVKEGTQFTHDTTLPSTDVGNNDTVDPTLPSSSLPPPLPPPLFEVPLRATGRDIDDLTVDSSDSSNDTCSSEADEIGGRKNSTRNAKYVVLTLREALINSLVIIAFGCLGFYLIEGLSLVDSWYFTTVLLTSTGYGDIVPKSDGGKLFATVYLLVAGTILLNNMSMISMIPLELRKRRTEQAVLGQFGDSLDDDALRELATGPLIHRINLDGKDSRGLDECTREMFALAMMIRLGKVTEVDIKQTFAAFRKLDVNNEGVLNSKSIIGCMIQKRRRTIHLNQQERSEQQRRQQAGASQGFTGNWIHTGVPLHPPPPPQFYEGIQNRNVSSISSISGSFASNFQRHSAHPSDHTPLLSMSERPTRVI